MRSQVSQDAHLPLEEVYLGNEASEGWVSGSAGGVTVASVPEGARGAGVQPRYIHINSEVDPFDTIAMFL